MGQRDYVECFIPTEYDEGWQITRITYWVALACDLKMTEKGIPMGGGNYDKAHEVVSTLAYRLFGRFDALHRDRMLVV